MCPPVFLCLFCARLALLKTGFSNQNLTQKGLKIELVLQKTQKLDCLFFEIADWSHKFQHLTNGPTFKVFSLDALHSEQKPSVTKTGRPAGQPA